MEKYNRYCPVAKAADILCEKWVILILREFMMGSTRFAQLRRGLPKISPSVLSRRLKEIEMQGVITRIKRSDNSFEYRLTEAGEEIRPIVLSFGAWGYKWVKNKINKEDLDAGHLLWDMRHCINIEYFENQRVVVHIELSDQRNIDRYWWMLIDSNGVDLCFEDIGQDPDIIVVTTLSFEGCLARACTFRCNHALKKIKNIRV